MVKAAVLYSQNNQFKLENIQIKTPTNNEVLVKIHSVGICHTDLLVRDGISRVPFPNVLGHEGAGIVEQIGDSVTHFKEGDKVVLTFDYCHECPNCQNDQVYACDHFVFKNFQSDKKVIKQNDLHITHFFGQSSFSEYALCTEANLVKITDEYDGPLEILGPLGCGIQTGAGAVFNKLKPHKTNSIVIFGCGAVGLSAVMAAKSLECKQIIAVDLNDKRLDKAKQLGATHTINGKNQNIMENIKQLTNNRGTDYSVESSGHPRAMEQAIECLARGGVCALTGTSNEQIMIDARTLRDERTVAGVLEGSANPKEFIPKLLNLYKENKFPFDKLLTYYQFDHINQAIKDLENGEVIKPVLIL